MFSKFLSLDYTYCNVLGLEEMEGKWLSHEIQGCGPLAI